MIRFLAAVLVIGFGSAHAGDPCPISFNIYDLGAPEWLDRDALLDGLESKDSWVGISYNDGAGGVTVLKVSPNSPAAEAGIHKDDLITHAAGTAYTSHKALADLFRKTAPGAKLALTVKRGEASKDLALTLGRNDPVVGALTDYASAQTCARVRRGDALPDLIVAARKQAFEGNKRFRCEDAHKALAKADFGAAGKFEAGDIFIVRGSKRILIANTGWATHCVYAKELDGKNLTPANLKKVFDKIAQGYIADRHANP